MIDIHSHILPGFDDGAETMEESLRMLEMAAAGGTTDIVATPHANIEYRFEPERVEAAVSDLQACAAAPRIHPGCDFHLSYDNIRDALDNPTRYTINHRCYLLVEFSDMMIFRNSGDILRALLEGGLVPVITHPERNSLLHDRLRDIEDWVGAGCLLQVTGHSLLGLFGERARDFAGLLMKRGLVHVLASDAHDSVRRHPGLAEVFRHVEQRHGMDIALRLLEANPRAILDGLPVEQAGGGAKATRRKWYRFWG